MNIKSALLLLLLAAVLHAGHAELSCYQCATLGSTGSDPCHNPSKHNMKATPCTSQTMADMKQNKEDMKKAQLNNETSLTMDMMDENSGKMMTVCMKSVIMIGGQTVLRRECMEINDMEVLTTDRCRMLLALNHGSMDGNIEFCGVCDKNACNGY